MSTIDKKQYEKAQRIIKAYPDALKIVEQYNAENKIPITFTHIDLYGILPVRACNIIGQYFKDNFPRENYILELWNFPIEYFSKIDIEKIRNTRNCGKTTCNEILNVIKEHNSK